MTNYYRNCEICSKPLVGGKRTICSKDCEKKENLKLIYGESFPVTADEIDALKNGQYRVSITNKNLPLKVRAKKTVNVIKAYFARSITQGDSTIHNHADFMEYLQAWIYNEAKKTIIIEDNDLLHEMEKRFGKKKSEKLKAGYSNWNIHN